MPQGVRKKIDECPENLFREVVCYKNWASVKGGGEAEEVCFYALRC